MKSLLYASGFLACTIAFAGCGGGGGGQSAGSGPLPVVSPTIAATPTPGATLSSTFAVQANPTTVPLPGVAGFSGSVAIPGIIGLGSITMTVSTTAPAGVSALRARVLTRAGVRAAASGDTSLIFITLTPTQAITLDGAPGVNLTLPSGYDLRGRNVYLAYSQMQSVAAWAPVAGPGSVSGSALIIAPTSSRPIAIPAGTSAVFVVFDTGIASLQLSTPNPPMTIGSPSQPTFEINGSDEFGATIGGTLPQPIAIADSDTSGRTTLGGTSVTSLPTAVPITYDGKGDAFTLTASQGTITGSVNAITTLPKETPISNAPPIFQGLIVGPGGELWTSTGSGVGSITTGALFTALPDPSTQHDAAGYNLVEGSDGNVWADYHDASEVDGINRVTPSGQFTSYNFSGTLQTSSSEVDGMVLGPDGAVWFGLSSSILYEPGIGIGRIDTAGNIRQVLSTSTAPSNLIVGPDGNFWFSLGPNVAKMTPAGVLTTYTLPGSSSQANPLRFVVGPDGNFWAPFAYGSQNLIKFSTNGSVVSTTPISYDPVWDFPFVGSTYVPIVENLVVDHAGNVYFTDFMTQGVVRITPSGSVSAYPTFATRSNIVDNPMQLVVGNDGDLYLTSTAVLNSTQAGLVPALTKIDPSLW